MILSLPIVVHQQRIKVAIQRAKDICLHYEDTPQCKIAWDRVVEFDRAMTKDLEKEKKKKEERFSEIETREYDI